MFYSITVTFPDESSAKSLTRELLEKKLVACSNLYPVESAYWWKGRIEEAKEWMVELKTQTHLFDKVEEMIRELHPYENPCVVAHTIEAGSKVYLDWIKESTD